MFSGSDYYWEIELYSGETIQVKPENAKAVQTKIASQSGAITTPTRSIIVKDIKDFRITDKIYTDKKLLEDANRAFKEPQYSIIKENGREYEAVKARWVKKSVPTRRWDTYFRLHAGYKKLSERDGYVTMAFVVPLHNIDYDEVQNLTPDEERQLSRKVE